MTLELKYGAGARLELPDEGVELVCANGPAKVLADPAAELAAALRDPLDYPPLADAVLPDDRVAVAVDEHLPQAAALVCTVVTTLVSAGISADDITVVQSPSAYAVAENPLSQLNGSLQGHVKRLIHDPRDREQLALLASMPDGRPLYLNRALCDADVVVPLGVLRSAESFYYRGIFGGVYPSLADLEAMESFRRPLPEAGGETGDRRRNDQRELVKQLGWWLGARLTVQVIPGIGGIGSILAGDIDAVAARGGELCRAHWEPTITGPAGVVIVAVEGGRQEQTWSNLARVVAAARRAVVAGGVMVLCTEISELPGPALKRLGQQRDWDESLDWLTDVDSEDAHAAAQLALALREGSVFLLSHLDDEVVEDLGMTPVGAHAEVRRLAGQFDSCLAIPAGQFAVPMFAD